MKRTIVNICLLISVGFNLYFINSSRDEVSVDELLVEKNDSIQTTQSAINKNPKLEQVKQNNLRGIKNDILEIQDNVDTGFQESKANDKIPNYVNEEEIDKAKEAWRKKASDFMLQDLALDAQVIDEYFQLDVRREKAISEFIQKRMDDNGGDQFFYTLEDIVAENKIHEKFLNELKTMLGKEGYERYKKFRNEHNQKIISSGEGFFLIEL